MKSAVYEEVLMGPWFAPFESGFVQADAVGIRLTQFEFREIEEALHTLANSNMIVRPERLPDELHDAYVATERVWRERETMLRKRGRRVPCLLNQREYPLEDLVVAILMAREIQNRRHRGLLADGRPRTLLELEIYLCEFSTVEITDAVERMVQNLLLTRRVDVANVPFEDKKLDGLELSLGAQRDYATRIQRSLMLAANESILDVIERTSISVFWAWQSDYNPSRSQIYDALENALEICNRNWRPVLPLRITMATEPGDGAVKIDWELQKKIRAADFVVADLTPVGRLFGRRLPNPTVLIEVGFAISVKEADQIILVVRKRNTMDLPGDGRDAEHYPFDIDHLRRLEYEGGGEIRSKLAEELRQHLHKRGLLR